MIWPVAILVLTLWTSLTFAARGVRTEAGAGGRVWVLSDRVDVVIWATECTAMLAVARAVGPWDVVPPMIWGVALGLAVLGLLLGLWSWPRLRWLRTDSRPTGRVLLAGLEVLVAGTLVVLVI